MGVILRGLGVEVGLVGLVFLILRGLIVFLGLILILGVIIGFIFLGFFKIFGCFDNFLMFLLVIELIFFE